MQQMNCRRHKRCQRPDTGKNLLGERRTVERDHDCLHANLLTVEHHGFSITFARAARRECSATRCDEFLTAAIQLSNLHCARKNLLSSTPRSAYREVSAGAAGSRQ